MKKNSVLALISTSLFLLIGCADFWNALFDGSGGGSSETIPTVEATETKQWNYSSSNDLYVADETVLNVNVSGDIGKKTLYLVKVNPTDYIISKNDTRIAASIKAGGEASRSVVTEFPQLKEYPTNIRKHFIPPEMPKIPANSSARSASVPNPAYSEASVEKSWSIGDRKQIYVDVNSDMNQYVQKTATLRAKGTRCYVWIVDDYYASEASGNKANTAIAQKFASKFDTIYPLITNVFGEESDELIKYISETSVNFVDMETQSDTGTKINIVIYDIGVDYKDKDTLSTGGVVGYFYAKDYYYSTYNRSDIVGKSNKGKYFYIDSAYAVNDINDTISTLAHEFQHMINFNQKNILHDKNPDTNYNEMLSMLCEDMMQEYLELDDDKSPKNRLQIFNALYYVSGIREYRNDESSKQVYSYSTAYAFGAWLARNYGGAALIKEISQNDSVDNDSLVDAVNSLNSTTYTFDDLFRQFVRALLNQNSFYTLNKDAAQTIGYNSSYYYPMKKINLFSDVYAIGSLEVDSDILGNPITFADYYKDMKGSSYNFYGPFVLNTSAKADLRPNYGITLHEVKTYRSGVTSDTIKLSSSGKKGLQLYLIIQ